MKEDLTAEEMNKREPRWTTVATGRLRPHRRRTPDGGENGNGINLM